MPFPSILSKLSATILTLNSIIVLLYNLLILFAHLTSVGFKSCPELSWLQFPLGNLLPNNLFLRLFWLFRLVQLTWYGFWRNRSFIFRFSKFSSIKSLSFRLKDLNTYFLMLSNSIRIEHSFTALSTLHHFSIIICILTRTVILTFLFHFLFQHSIKIGFGLNRNLFILISILTHIIVYIFGRNILLPLFRNPFIGRGSWLWRWWNIFVTIACFVHWRSRLRFDIFVLILILILTLLCLVIVIWVVLRRLFYFFHGRL